MNRIKAEQFKKDLIDLLYKYDLSFGKFTETLKDDNVCRYLAGLEKYREEFYDYCKKTGFII